VGEPLERVRDVGRGKRSRRRQSAPRGAAGARPGRGQGEAVPASPERAAGSRWSASGIEGEPESRGLETLDGFPGIKKAGERVPGFRLSLNRVCEDSSPNQGGQVSACHRAHGSSR